MLQSGTAEAQVPSYVGEFLSSPAPPHHGTHHMRGDLPVLAEFLRLHQLLWNCLSSLQKESGVEINIGLLGHSMFWLPWHLQSRTGLLTFLRSVVSTVALP